MSETEAFQILGIAPVKEEKAIKAAYRERLSTTNPEDDPEGFKRLRSAYETACRFAEQTEEEETADETDSGLWVRRAEEIYCSFRRRCELREWEELFRDEVFLALEEEENCRVKLLGFLMNHFRLPGEVWKLLDKKLAITGNMAKLRENFPADFVRYIAGKCERGEEVDFSEFEGAEDAPYDLFLQYYDSCRQALREEDAEAAGQNIREADGLRIRHPLMEVCRAQLAELQDKPGEAAEIYERELARYPKNTVLMFVTAEFYYHRGEKEKAAELYHRLKEDNKAHYMANVRLTEWYCDRNSFQEAKECAEHVIAGGGGESFLELLARVNAGLEPEFERKWREGQDASSALELGWCYLQDGKIAPGISLAEQLEKLLPAEKEAEWLGLMAKLYVEGADYREAIAMTYRWEKALLGKLQRENGEEAERDRDRLRQAKTIRMECCHNLGFCEEGKFAEAVREGEALVTGSVQDIGIRIELAQIYVEMGEYERCGEIVDGLVKDYQVYAAYAVLLEAYRRQLNAAGVVRTGRLCIEQFPEFVKSYEYMAKVYLDLGYGEELTQLLEEAKQNGVGSDILEAYRYQQKDGGGDLEIIDNQLRRFRKEYTSHINEGEACSRYYEAGLPKLTKWLYQYPDGYLFVERGIFHRDAHHYQEARADFEKALALNPANPYAHKGLSFTWRYLGDYEKALFYMKKAILYMDEDMSPVIYTDLAEIYSLLGLYDKALAACMRYEELTQEQDRRNWYRDLLAGIYTDRKETVKAWAELGGKVNLEKRDYYKECVKSCICCGEQRMAERMLKSWELLLKSESGLLGRIFGRTEDRTEEKEAWTEYYCQRVWRELVFGGRQKLREYLSALKRCAVALRKKEGLLADLVFACAVCGFETEGKQYAAMLKLQLSKLSFEPKDAYCHSAKLSLYMEVAAKWYTGSPEELQELFDRETSCGICHHCQNAVCGEMEGMHILFLLRQERADEAKERLLRNERKRPCDEYMRAIGHLLFSQEADGLC